MDSLGSVLHSSAQLILGSIALILAFLGLVHQGTTNDQATTNDQGTANEQATTNDRQDTTNDRQGTANEQATTNDQADLGAVGVELNGSEREGGRSSYGCYYFSRVLVNESCCFGELLPIPTSQFL